MDRLTFPLVLGVVALTGSANAEPGPPPLVSSKAFAVDAEGHLVDPQQSHASLSRAFPTPLLPTNVDGDPDALRWVVAASRGEPPSRVDLVSTDPSGTIVDRLDGVLLRVVDCPAGVPREASCATTVPIRATVDMVDRNHPAVVLRSLRAEVGGRIRVESAGQVLASILVGGPRQGPLGPVERLRAHLRVRIVRIAAGAAPALGGSDAKALNVARAAVRAASALWGQCGIQFGRDDQLDLAVVAPPVPHLLAVGCDLGLPATGGGEIAFRVGRARFRVKTTAGQTPTQVAAEVVSALKRGGYEAHISANARIGSGALRSVDVLVRGPAGEPQRVERDDTAPLSSDQSLSVCLGEVDLADGLTHFDDLSAGVGTLEERTLIKGLADDDPRTIDVFIVPYFARTARIGESFISADESHIENVVIIDRSGVRARSRSHTLAHELGHVLLDMPGHPDDLGSDHPELLMDADAADATIFGPRRLTLEECTRALGQSGPDVPVPLLEPWPLDRRGDPSSR